MAVELKTGHVIVQENISWVSPITLEGAGRYYLEIHFSGGDTLVLRGTEDDMKNARYDLMKGFNPSYGN